MGLLEVLVALPLIALLGGVAVQLLLSVQRQVVQADGTLGATRTLRHSAGILAAELRVLQPRDLVLWTPTSVEFDGSVGVGFVCAANRGQPQLLLVGSDSLMSVPDSRATVWNQPPQAGDRVSVWLRRATPTDSLRADSALVRAIGTSTDCARSPLLQGRAGDAIRVTLVAATSDDVATGTPVRITRRTRYLLYRASDNDWYVGRQSRSDRGWDIVQPVAGPLQPPRDRGLVLRVYDAYGVMLADASQAVPARVSIELRAPRRSGRASPRVVTIDSLRVDVALRSVQGGAP